MAQKIQFIILQLWKSEHRSHWAKIKMSAGGPCSFLDAKREKTKQNSALLSFLASRGCLHALALNPLSLSSKSIALHLPLP